ncbi:potassium channel family protein [Zwartia sp.]|uniref:potassium channel family protein n=1 Tax=Zwartia sp. TaxID=2978004 RepID=UPI0027156E99|nr:potassium channel family protein [Zwartia sp.]MDO9023196.1 potassium channel family protein [Zwartia sp.]
MLFTIAFALNTTLMIATILLHYESLYYLDKTLKRLSHIKPRVKVLIGVGIIFITHIVEIWLFGLGYFLSLYIDGMGEIVGQTGNLFLDCVYLSFITYTTVGYGDIVAQGSIRYLTGVEALTGLILITWSASFLFLEMQRYWSNEKKK